MCIYIIENEVLFFKFKFKFGTRISQVKRSSQKVLTTKAIFERRRA